ncbi:MAG: hypothetical protein ACYC41_09095 [Bacillota bacterium]
MQLVRTLVGQECQGLLKSGYSLVYTGRLYHQEPGAAGTVIHYTFCRHNLSRGTSDPIVWSRFDLNIRIATEDGSPLWKAEVTASEVDELVYQL